MAIQMINGREVWLPDELMPQDPLAFDTLGPRGTGPPPPPPTQSFVLPGELAKQAVDPGRAPPPPPPPPPTKKIGPGLPINDEVALAGGPRMQPSVTGGALPTEQQQQGGGPIGNRPDQVIATIDNDPKVLAAKSKAAAKQEAAAAKQAAAQAKVAASPEGQAQLAANEGLQAKGNEAELARIAGQSEAKELDEVAIQEQAGFDRAEEVRAQQAEEAKQWQEGLKAKNDAVNSAVKAEAEYKVDDNRRWKEMGTGKTILFWISAALSGLGDALQKKSGPNMALGMMQAVIDRDVAAQVREREQLGKRIGIQRNSIDSYRQQMGDWREAAKLKISEEYDRTAQQIRVVAAKYGSDKAKLRGETLAAQLEGQAAAIRGGAAEAAFGRDMQRANLKVSQGQLGLGWAGLKQRKYEFGEQMKMQAAQLDVEAQKAAAAGNVKQAEAIRELGISGASGVAKDAEGKPIVDADGNPVIDRAVVLKNQDGTPYLAPTKDEAIKLRGKMSAANRIVDILDEVRAIRDRSGGESKWGNSDDYQRLQVLKENLVVIKKAGTEGMSSDADMARLERALGADSPASFRAQAAKLDEGREQVVKQINADLKSLNYNGEPLTFPDPIALKGGAKTAEQIDVKNAIGYAGIGNAAITQGKGLKPEDKDMGAWMSQGVAIPPSIKSVIDTQASLLSSKGNTRAGKDAGEYLLKISNEARDPKVKEYAARKLEELRASSTMAAPVDQLEPSVR
jgi:hypothetical protein